MILLAYCMLLPSLLGFLGLVVIWPPVRGTFAPWLVRAMLGLPVGQSFVSFQLYVLLWLWGPRRDVLATVEALELGALLSLVAWRGRHIQPVSSVGSNALPALSFNTLWLRRVLGAGLLLEGVLTAITMVRAFRDVPHGWWDAWAIWNLRARFLFRLGPEWREAFSAQLFHTDYPLALPLSVLRCWLYLGEESLLVPHLLAALWLVALVGILIAGIAALRSPSLGLLAGVLLLGTHRMVEQASWLCADIPLVCLEMSVLILLFWYECTPGASRRLLLVAGFLLAAASWTKNEGLLFALLVLLVYPWRRGLHGRSGWPDRLTLSSGAVVGLIPLLHFKLTLAPPNDLFAGQTCAALLSRLGDPTRHLMIAMNLAGFVLSTGGWNFLVLALWWTLLRPRYEVVRRSDFLWRCGVILLLLLAGFYLVYLFTPHDLYWHINTSVARIAVQLWPLILLWIVLQLPDPERPRVSLPTETALAASNPPPVAEAVHLIPR